MCKCSRKAHRSRALHDPQLIALQDEELGERPHALGGYHELGPCGEGWGELHRSLSRSPSLRAVLVNALTPMDIWIVSVY